MADVFEARKDLAHGARPKLPENNFKPLRFPLGQNKARLIQVYLRLFGYITHQVPTATALRGHKERPTQRCGLQSSF